MHILINNKEAVLKKGVSFDYIAENRFFTGADSYTLSITFPLKGCQKNLDIFGHINRKDNNLDRLLMDCEIYDRGFHVVGAVNIVEISELEVKTQFLQGKSASNYASDFDKIYINEMQIGQARDMGHFDTRWHFATYGDQRYTGFVSLPWVNNTSGNIQNKLIYSSIAWGYYYSNVEEDAPLSVQYYLIYLLERIFQECRYDYDISALINSPYRFLVIFNTFPYAWEIDEYALALPHWTLSEFLEQIELFTNGMFEIDQKLQKVTFSFNVDVLKNQKQVNIENVLDEYQVEISDKTENTYQEQMNIKYAEDDHQMQNFYSCPWASAQMNTISYSSFSYLKSVVEPYLQVEESIANTRLFKSMLYAKDIDTYFVLKCYMMRTNTETGKKTYHMRLQPVNVYGPRTVDKDENAKVRELGIVPVCIDHCNKTIGDCVFLECGTYGETEEGDENQTMSANSVLGGKKEQKKEFFNKLYVAFWNHDVHVQNVSNNNLYPLPWIDNFWVDQYNNIYTSNMQGYDDFSMRLSGNLINHMWEAKNKIDQSKKFSFSFLVENGNIPDVKSIFYIHGKRYLAEKITATFTENGMSQLVKMVAYRII